MKRKILVTGGAGFIGSNFVHYLMDRASEIEITVLDKLTYAGNLENLNRWKGDGRLRFIEGDIADAATVERVIHSGDFTEVAHFAAESHVDRSIHGPEEFVRPNVQGTFHILEALRKEGWANGSGERKLLHVSTDEVFGSLGPEGEFSETTCYAPNSPYSASKAASDHLVRAYHHTYGLHVVTSNCSNNYGPYQFPEKLIPLMILHALQGKPLPIYGEGKNIRDWLHVEDHCSALDVILQKGRAGETYQHRYKKRENQSGNRKRHLHHHG